MMIIGGEVTSALLAVAGFGLVAAAFLVRGRLLVVSVRGISMEPTLRDGDRVLVRRKSIASVRRGDIVVVAGRDLFGRDEYTVKRVMALPGEIVPADFISTGRIEPGAMVPDSGVVLVGDNSDQSYDSRQVGFYPASGVVGAVIRKVT
jgi:signal peptidase I